MTITSLSLPSGGMGCKAVPKLSGVRTLCWILLDTDDFNQQQNIFCNAMVRQRQAGCHTGQYGNFWGSILLEWHHHCDVQPVNFHRPTNSAAAIHSWHHYEKLWTFSYQMSPWPWLCPDEDRQAVTGLTACHPTPCPISRQSESWLHWIIKKVKTHLKINYQWCIHKQNLRIQIL